MTDPMTGGAPGPEHEPEPEGDSPVDDGRLGDAQSPAGAPPRADDGPRPLGVHRTPTGNADVDAQLARLADADHLAASGHLEVYEDVHRGLRDALTALDQRPGPPAPSGPYDNRS
ncbi:hypothetical protein AB0I22_37725 [Streptomyces sp. NPDC050610]|uniref:hypothetical protein n=1 Tax=Streptomyces sp. NPDC050610 TaxID=3157097 RepID=UPI003448AE9C